MTGEGLRVLDPPSPPSQSHLETHDEHATLRYKGPPGCQGSSYGPCKEADTRPHAPRLRPHACSARPDPECRVAPAGLERVLLSAGFPSGALTESWAWTG